MEQFLMHSEEDSVVLDLQDPIYQNGMLSTTKGGVLMAPNLRIQAEKITYIRQLDNTPQIFTVSCEGHLLVDYKNRILVGESFDYDFLTHTGRLICGKTASPPCMWAAKRFFSAKMENSR